MVQIKDENYYVVHGWMRNILGLKGNALCVYAIIYGFSQTDHQEYTASINYMAGWLGVSRPTVINTLKDLVEKGFLTKTSKEVNGVIFNRYRAVTPEFTGGKNILLGSQNILPPPSKEILPNNKYNKKNGIKKENVEQSSTPSLCKDVIDYLNEKVGSKFRYSSKDTIKLICAREKDGYSLSDFKKVIDVKVKEWQYDKKMAPYLRPSTLFSPKFESYLNQYREDPVSKLEISEELADQEF